MARDTAAGGPKSLRGLELAADRHYACTTLPPLTSMTKLADRHQDL